MSEMFLPPLVSLISHAGWLPTACCCRALRALSVVRLMDMVMSVWFVCAVFLDNAFSSNSMDVPSVSTIERLSASLDGSFTASSICFMTLAGSFTVSICFSSTEKSMVTTPVFTSLPMTVFSLERSISSIVAVVLLTVESTRIVFSSPDTGTVTEVEGVVLPPELPLPVPPDVPPELLPPVLLPPLEPLSFFGIVLPSASVLLQPVQ